MRHISSTPAAMPFCTSAPDQRAMLRDREHCGNDDRARMHGPAFERVVVVLAMRGRAVDERRVVRTERAHMTDGGGFPFRRDARARCLDVVVVARGDAEARDVEHQEMHGLARSRRELVGIKMRRELSEISGNRHAVRSLRAFVATRHSLNNDADTMRTASTRKMIEIGSSRKIESSPPESASERR